MALRLGAFRGDALARVLGVASPVRLPELAWALAAGAPAAEVLAAESLRAVRAGAFRGEAFRVRVLARFVVLAS